MTDHASNAAFGAPAPRRDSKRLLSPRAAAFALALAGATSFYAPTAAACGSDVDCTTAPLLHCDPALPTPACVECRGDAQCPTGALCERRFDRAAFSKCVRCTEENHAACSTSAEGSACLSSGSCGCLRDDHCGDVREGRVCESGTCKSGCRGDGSRPCPPGDTCTARGAGVGVCVGAPEIPPVRADAGPLSPSPPISGGGNCAMALHPGGAGSMLDWLLMTWGFAIAILRRRTRRDPRRVWTVALLASLLGALGSIGCSRTPTPLRPGLDGSIGLPHKGVLVGGVRVEESANLKFLRNNDRRWATARFGRALTRAADRVARERPGAPLVLGDLSIKGGGVLLPHLSHRSGRDADLLLYLTTLDGAPVASPGFVHVREDGLAWDERGKRFLRFDVERQWLLLKALLEDEEGQVQFAFASKTLRALLTEWAVARGEPTELVYRAITVLVQPNPGGEHDDHFHVRTACTETEVESGCEPSGPDRPWLALAKAAHTSSGQEEHRSAEGDAERTQLLHTTLARLLFEPLEPGAIASPRASRGAP